MYIIGRRANRLGESAPLPGLHRRRGVQLGAAGAVALLAGIGIAWSPGGTHGAAPSPPGASAGTAQFRDVAVSGNPADAGARLHAPNLAGAMAQEQAALDSARKALGAPALRDAGSTSAAPSLAVSYMDASHAGGLRAQGLPESPGPNLGFRAAGTQPLADATSTR